MPVREAYAVYVVCLPAVGVTGLWLAVQLFTQAQVAGPFDLPARGTVFMSWALVLSPRAHLLTSVRVATVAACGPCIAVS